jgi:curved DNA-binding protein CbpA
MNGQLSEHPLAELVREISLKGLSGTMRLQHEQAKVAVYFDAGQVIYAASNLKELRVGEYLKKQGLISERELTALGTKRSDPSLIAALSSQRVIDRTKIEAVVATQVADLLRVALLWSGGKWEFDNRSRLGDPVRIRLDTGALLIQTARKMESKFVSSRFPSAEELLSPASSPPGFNDLLPAEGFVLSRLEGPIKLRELIALSGQSESEAIKMIYGLALGGFLQREHWPMLLKTKQPKVSVPAVDAPLPEETASPPTATSSDIPVYELDDYLVRLEHASNHYEVLNIAHTASVDEIKANYYALARRYHPDRFHLQASTPLHARIESAFARIAQAYETLTNSSRRSGYDAKLVAMERAKKLSQTAPKPSKDQAVPVTGNDTDAAIGSSENAEENFRQGYSALQQGQTKPAMASLAAAARMVPDEPRYRAYYGRALSVLGETRRLAEAELQAAIKLDPANSSYRVWLAALYYDLGFLKRAERELEGAVASDPNNPEARALMLKLNAARTTK